MLGQIVISIIVCLGAITGYGCYCIKHFIETHSKYTFIK